MQMNLLKELLQDLDANRQSDEYINDTADFLDYLIDIVPLIEDGMIQKTEEGWAYWVGPYADDPGRWVKVSDPWKVGI